MNVLLLAPLLLLADPAVLTQPTDLDNGYRQMYDLQFEAAHRSFASWMAQHPDDPLGPVSDAAAFLFAEFDRLHILQSEFFLHDDSFVNHAKPAPDLQVKQQFDEQLNRSQTAANEALARDPHNQNAQFATVMRLGLHADYLALIEKKYLPSLNEVKTGRAIAEQLIAANPAYGDAYLAIGVENYLLSLKAAPIRWLMRAGGAETNKDRGIANLSLTAQNGHYLVPYARVLLAVAALRDKNVARAKELLEGLTKQFPNNPLYSKELARLH
jgi:hypothetical protein